MICFHLENQKERCLSYYISGWIVYFGGATTGISNAQENRFTEANAQEEIFWEWIFRSPYIRWSLVTKRWCGRLSRVLCKEVTPALQWFELGRRKDSF